MTDSFLVRLREPSLTGTIFPLIQDEVVHEFGNSFHSTLYLLRRIGPFILSCLGSPPSDKPAPCRTCWTSIHLKQPVQAALACEARLRINSVWDRPATLSTAARSPSDNSLLITYSSTSHSIGSGM